MSLSLRTMKCNVFVITLYVFIGVCIVVVSHNTILPFKMASVVIFCDVVDAGLVGETVGKSSTKCAVVTVLPGKNVREQVRKVVCAPHHAGAVFLNWCRGGLESVDRASARSVAECLSAFKVPVGSSCSKTLQLDTEDLQMLCAYGKLPLVPFCFLRSEANISATRSMTYPLSVWGLNEGLCSASSLVGQASSEEELLALVKSSLADSNVVLVTEGAKAPTHVASLVWYGGEKYVVGAARTLGGAPEATFPPTLAKAIVDAGILQASGSLNVALHIAGDDISVCFVDVVCSHTLPHLDADFDLEAHFASVVPTALTAHQLAKPRHIVSYDPAMKGYFLRAAMDIAKGDVAFRDERRRFSIATKPHVEATWSEEEKVVFSEYAWPLDTEGHVYALWDDEPRLWRPINHSCDPNLVFGAGHSLNVLASRDIKEGDDLTMDYATFCDFTMKPFQCYCGTSCCRGKIQPDEASLTKYGTNAWHRRHPTTL